MITFTVPGQPVPKGRPRFGKGRTYTPERTRHAELAIGWEFKRAAGARWVPLRGPISLSVRFYLGKARGARPDLDNLVKLVSDGLNHIAYDDDRQIVRLQASIDPADARGPRTVVEVCAHV